MSITKYAILVGVILLALHACKKDDDGEEIIPPRDRAEQQIAEAAILKSYLETHFFDTVPNPANPDYNIVMFDTIAGDNKDRQPIIESNLLQTKVVKNEDVDYTLYLLNFNKGAENKNNPTFADSTLITYRGELLYDLSPDDNNLNNGKIFDSSVTPVWLDLVTVVPGFRQGLMEFSGASEGLENADGTIDFSNDFGNFVLFMPSGLGYFNSGSASIPAYSPLIFSIQLYVVNESDHDGDGIPSYLEDLDMDQLVLDNDDNTDGDSFANYADRDDDGDGTLTKDEITSIDINGDGFIRGKEELIFYDDDGDGIKNHLDADDRDVKN
ncbi:FKBP-type peptidyl-prolyl cis-trans isomerase [Aquimarina sp. W85]|uniref:FKBP-type peptidyl-prolyl cis-trans isomerase n=1 Tax=Aquimarina rhodophyticola TaxID=3342246 RepID=UPI00366A85B0